MQSQSERAETGETPRKNARLARIWRCPSSPYLLPNLPRFERCHACRASSAHGSLRWTGHQAADTGVQPFLGRSGGFPGGLRPSILSRRRRLDKFFPSPRGAAASIWVYPFLGAQRPRYPKHPFGWIESESEVAPAFPNQGEGVETKQILKFFKNFFWYSLYIRYCVTIYMA